MNLRNLGIKVELYPSATTKLDKQLKYADRKGIPYVVIQGPDEVKRGMVQLKNLLSKSQQEISIDEIASVLP